jgi:stress response protein YsnF
MAKTVIGLFDRMDDARQLVQQLIAQGFEPDDISLVSRQEGEYVTERGEERSSGTAIGAGAGAALGGVGGLLVGLGALAIPGIGPVIAAGPLVTALAGAGIGAAAGGIIGALTDLGVPEEEAHYYAEGVRRGGALVTVETDDQRADRAAEIMERAGAIDVDERATHWRQSGWTRFDAEAGPSHAAERQAAESHRPVESHRAPEQHAEYAQDATPVRAADPGPERHSAATSPAGEQQQRVDQGEVKVPVVEGQVEVGKRQVRRSGVRLYTRDIERPIEEPAQLRDEPVTVERRPVDRPGSEADLPAFKGGTIELTEAGEEPVISKRSRMAEEVVVSKEPAERTETLRDAVARTEVEVGPVESGQVVTDYRAFESYDADFRSHYTTSLASRGHPYERWAPGYRYGYDVANDPRYAGRDWAAIEPEARRDWEGRHPGAWGEFKDTIHYAWDTVRGRP